MASGPGASPPALRTFHHRHFSRERLLGAPPASVSVCLPARNEAGTIGAILERLAPLRREGLIEQVLVIDGSHDGTGEIAVALGAEVHQEAALAPESGPPLGKGDAMWRALPLLWGDIVCFLDADSGDFGEHYVRGLVGPLLCDPAVSFVKGFYRRPFRLGEVTLPEGGGRVTELTARPLLARFYPELAALRQPLAGEFAVRRALLEQLPFATGYGVEIGLLLDAYARVGTAGMAQVDLEVRQNAHQPLRDLGPMAAAVLEVVALRLRREGRLQEHPHTSGAGAERPPLASLTRGYGRSASTW